MWSDFMKIFVLVFFAELGDKTQLATMTFASTAQSKWGSFLGASAALTLTSALAVLLGYFVSKYMGESAQPYIKTFAGTLFVILGALMIYGEMK